MQNTLVWEIISDLNKKERKALNLFVQSPYFNRREILMELMELILSSMKPQSRADLYGLLYPNEPFDDSKMRLLISNLHKLVLKFLLVNDVDDGLRSKKRLVEILGRKTMMQNFTKECKRLELMIKNETFRHPEYYRMRSDLKSLQNDYWIQKREIKSVDFEQMERDFNIYFISKKLGQFIEVIAGQNMYKIDYFSPLFDEIMLMAKRTEYAHSPVISFYVRLINVLKSGTKEDFLVLKEQLFELTQIFPAKEAQNLYFMVLNYCVRKINENSVFYSTEAFELYQLGLDSELILMDGFISKSTFNNIVAIGIKKQKLKWIEWFVEQYKNKLHKADFITTYSINKARIAYETKDFDAALIFLQEADYESIVSSINARVLQLKIYFELGEYDLLRSHLKSIKVYAQRKKEYAYHSAFLADLIRFTWKIIRLAPNDKSGLQNIKNEILNKDFYGKDWLLGQLVLQSA